MDAEVRDAIKNHAGEEFDIKPYEADMRHLINTYIQADAARVLGDLETLPLTDLIIKTGIHDAIAIRLNARHRLSRTSIAETIINNIRKTIIRSQLTDPRFYAEMSQLLQDLIKQKRDDTKAYEAFLREAEKLVKKLDTGVHDAHLPTELQGKREAAVLYNNLPDILAPKKPVPTVEMPTLDFDQKRLQLALQLDAAIKAGAPWGWRGDETRERMVQTIIHETLGKTKEATRAVFEIVKNQPGY